MLTDSHTLLAEAGPLRTVKGMQLIAPLLADASINDILINGTHSVFIERAGRLERTELRFPNEETVYGLAENIAAYVGRTLDPARPLVDARLPDGSRVNIVAPPLALDGTTVSIRKFARAQITLDAMAEAGNISPQLAEFLKIAGRCRLNVLISGGTGSGKTTLLNAISQYIDDAERVVTIEDAAELRLIKPHVVRLETRPASGSGYGEEVSTRDLLRNALRMRPDRILVGEVRGPEAFDMMQAMNTGHEGSLTTIHANHPRDALARLENMMNMVSLNMASRAVRGQIVSALHLVVQISRMRDGLRRVTFVSEIVGMEGDIITMQDLMHYQTTGDNPDGTLAGQWKMNGVVPRFTRRIAYWGEEERFARLFGIPLSRMTGK